MLRTTFKVGDDTSKVRDAVLCRDVNLTTPDGSMTIRRGVALTEANARLSADYRGLQLEVVVPSESDVSQPEASRLLAIGIAGPGVVLDPPHQGQVNVRADRFGLLRVRANDIVRLNRAGSALVASALDGKVVTAGEVVAIVKAAELFLDQGEIDTALARTGGRPLLRVPGFEVETAGLIAGGRIRSANLKSSSGHLDSNLRRFGAHLAAVEHIQDDPDQIAETYRSMLGRDVGVILVAGSIVLDPKDPFLVALDRIGAKLIRRGAPIDPGTMFWVAYAGTVPIFGLASCELYGRLSILDLLLPYALAGERITSSLIAELGYGGLLGDTQMARRPANWHNAGEPMAKS